MLIAHLGKNAYYRYYRKETLLNPEAQAIFGKVFKENGVVEPPVFEEYVEMYAYPKFP